MPGKSQSHTDAVLNVLRGTDSPESRRTSGCSPWRPPMTTLRARNWLATVTRAKPSRSARPRPTSGNVRKVANTNNIQFGPALVDWSQAVAFGVFASLAGALLYWDTLPTPKTVQQDDYGQFAVGTLVVKED